MIRTKGEAGTGNVVEAVRHMRTMMGQIRLLQNLPREEWMSFAKEQGAPYELVAEVAAGGRLPVVNFAAGGIATPADAALMMKLGSEGVLSGQVFSAAAIRLSAPRRSCLRPAIITILKS